MYSLWFCIQPSSQVFSFLYELDSNKKFSKWSLGVKRERDGLGDVSDCSLTPSPPLVTRLFVTLL